MILTFSSTSLTVSTVIPDWFSTLTLTGIDCPGTYPLTGNDMFTDNGGDPQQKQQKVLFFSICTDSYKMIGFSG